MAIELVSGQDMIDVTLSRRLGVLRVTIKTHPTFEQLVKSWGEGEETLEVSHYGRIWKPIGEEPLRAYPVNEYPNISINTPYRLDSIGMSLDMSGKLNFSFCRLVGTSVGDGVTFEVVGIPMSTEKIKAIFKQIQEAQKLICDQFLKKANLRSKIVVME